MYAASSEQLTQWLAEWGAPPPPVAPLPITTVAPGVAVDGPAPEVRRHHEGPVRGEVPAMTGSPRERSSARNRAGSSTRSGGRSTRSASSARSRPIRRRAPTSTGCAASSNGSTTPSNSGASGIALGPIFASRTHGYDTTDHYRIDPRLGDDADFDHLVAEAHRRGLRVLLDGVFNHVGTDFPRYRDAVVGSDTAWFRNGSDFDTFEGHGELIALNHDNPDVVDYTVDVMTHWLGRGADGWRLDAAYAVPDRFWAQVLPRVREEFPRRVVRRRGHPRRLLGARARQSGFDSVTQYELWKAIWSSLNDGNFHELDWALRAAQRVSRRPSCR